MMMSKLCFNINRISLNPSLPDESFHESDFFFGSLIRILIKQEPRALQLFSNSLSSLLQVLAERQMCVRALYDYQAGGLPFRW